MNKKMILLILIICVVIIGVIYLFVLQSGGRWIYVHEFESTPAAPSEFYNLTTGDMERFPFLLESIQNNADVHISEVEYNELMNFLDVPMFVEWNNRYYEVQIRMS
jgi:hypothetical protein